MNSIYELIEYRSNAHPDRIAVIFEDQKITYKTLLEKINSTGDIFKRIIPGNKNRIALLDYNSIESLYLFLASSSYDIIPCILNFRLTKEEISSILEKSNIDILFYGEEFGSMICDIEAIVPDLKFYSLKNEFNNLDSLVLEKEKIKVSDIFVELFTSGTTGTPKIVPLTQKNILAVIKNLSIELPGFGSDSINLVCAPFFHIGGVGYFLLGIYIGCTNVLIRKFSPKLVAESIVTWKVTNALLVPAMMQSILEIPNIQEYDFSLIRNIQYGGSPMSIDLLKKAKNVFGSKFTCAYGLTESSGISTLLRFDEIESGLNNAANENKLSSVGKPIAGTKLVIKNQDGINVRNSEIGEVCLQSEQIFQGYREGSGFNTSDFDQEGYFHTGDIGFINELGNLYLLDRKNDMILSKAENIYPIEVERFFANHSSIKEIAVVGIKDSEYGEIVTAFIVLNPEKSISLEDMKNEAKKGLASYKVPRKIFILTDLPKNPTGKIMRKELKLKYEMVTQNDSII